MATIAHHLGEKPITASVLLFCPESDNAIGLSVSSQSDNPIGLSRSENSLTESSNCTFQPPRWDVQPTAPSSQGFAGFAQHKVAWPWLGRAGHECQAVGALRTGLPAAVAERFGGLNCHTHAMAAVAYFPLAVFVDQ